MAKLPRWHQKHFQSVEAGGNGLFDDIAGAKALELGVVAKEVLEVRGCEAARSEVTS